jgi:hypothetical protein
MQKVSPACCHPPLLLKRVPEISRRLYLTSIQDASPCGITNSKLIEGAWFVLDSQLRRAAVVGTRQELVAESLRNLYLGLFPIRKGDVVR